MIGGWETSPCGLPRRPQAALPPWNSAGLPAKLQPASGITWDIMGTRGRQWNRMERRLNRQPDINEPLGLIFGVTGFAGPGRLPPSRGIEENSWSAGATASILQTRDPTRAGTGRDAIPRL